jgi:hypothetical protein
MFVTSTKNPNKLSESGAGKIIYPMLVRKQSTYRRGVINKTVKSAKGVADARI